MTCVCQEDGIKSGPQAGSLLSSDNVSDNVQQGVELPIVYSSSQGWIPACSPAQALSGAMNSSCSFQPREAQILSEQILTTDPYHSNSYDVFTVHLQMHLVDERRDK